jgi:uncharacterized membrane protein YdjX (TVP38/TMEM64 family)
VGRRWSPLRPTPGTGPPVAFDLVTSRRLWPLALILVLMVWAAWSWRTGGLMALVLQSNLTGAEAIARLRQWLEAAGPLAPVVYVAAVTVEVMVAPIPGLLLYAPGGAVFGGFVGGTLSLVGNVIGAGLAAWLAAVVGGRWVGAADRPRLQQIAARLRERGVLVILLLRINPLTSSDLVSYAAGLAGVPVWRVVLGTAAGMAPLCYAQAYASEWIVVMMPGSVWLLAVLAVAYMVGVVWLLFRSTLSETRTRA